MALEVFPEGTNLLSPVPFIIPLDITYPTAFSYHAPALTSVNLMFGDISCPSLSWFFPSLLSFLSLSLGFSPDPGDGFTPGLGFGLGLGPGPGVGPGPGAGFSLTVILTVFSIAPAFTLISASPAFLAVTFPEASTSAISGLSDS